MLGKQGEKLDRQLALLTVKNRWIFVNTKSRNVTMSRSEKVSPKAARSDCWELSHPSLARDQKIANGMEGEIPNLSGALPRSTNQNKKLWSDLCFEPTTRYFDRHPHGGGNVAQKESILFSSSLSDLFTQNLKLSKAKRTFCQTDSNHPSHLDETEAHTLKNLLPDEEELFLGMVEETGHTTDAHALDDSEDVDLFSCSGGIELEADANLLARNSNVQFAGGTSSSHWGFSGMVSSDHAYSLHPSSKFPVGKSHHEASSAESGSHSSIRVASVGSQFGISDPSYYSLGHGNGVLDNGCVPSFSSHSVPEVHNRSGIGIHRNLLDSVASFTGDICFNDTGNATMFMPQVGLNGHPMELNRAFAYSPEGSSPFNVPQCVPSNAGPNERQPSGSLFWGNWPSFINGDGGHSPAWVPGFPSVPHLLMSTGSPIHQQQVGSPPIFNASLWDRRQSYAGESLEASRFLSGSMEGVGFPGSSPSHPSEVSSLNVFHHAGRISSVNLSNNAELLSPQQMRHMLHKRSTNSSISLGLPSERVRSRRNETISNYADRKQYELNVDRILRGEDTRTTLMIKNIPNKYTSNMLLATINENHRGTYDFLYLPIDFKNKCNVGYAFINMVEPHHIVAFHKTLDGKKWEKFNSEKVASLAYARIQGKDALIAHFQNSSLMNEDKRCRPILFHTHGPNAGDQEPFPMGTNIRTRPGRLHSSSDDEDEKSNKPKYTGHEESSNELDPSC
ncbi:hypothetical protein Dimus_006844 [Dionaea muscipula]